MHWVIRVYLCEEVTEQPWVSFFQQRLPCSSGQGLVLGLEFSNYDRLSGQESPYLHFPRVRIPGTCSHALLCVHVWLCMCVPAGGRKKTAWDFFFCVSPSHFLRRSLSLTLELKDLPTLADQWVPGAPLVCSQCRRVGGSGMSHCARSLHRCLGPNVFT